MIYLLTSELLREFLSVAPAPTYDGYDFYAPAASTAA